MDKAQGGFKAYGEYWLRYIYTQAHTDCFRLYILICIHGQFSKFWLLTDRERERERDRDRDRDRDREEEKEKAERERQRGRERERRSKRKRERERERTLNPKP